MLSVDGAFSKTSHNYTLCIASCYDADNHIVILAWGFVPSELADGWSWWSEHLEGAYPVTGEPGYVVMTDRGNVSWIFISAS